MPNSIRLPLIVIVQILLLCSCALKSPSHRPGDSSPIENSVQPRSDSSNKPATDTVFNDHQEINPPTQSIEKDGLLLSYSMLAVPSQEGNLIRLSLVFRNLQDRSRIAKPKVSLLDASGNMISAYTKAGFIKIASHLTGKTSNNVTNSLINIENDKNSAKSRIEWANTYWLKHSYKIPAHGIAIGELVYHCTSLNLPMKLKVTLNKQEFVFTTQDSLPVVDEQ